MFRQFSIEIIANYSSLDADVAVLNADFKNTIHSGEVNDDSPLDGNHSSRLDSCLRHEEQQVFCVRWQTLTTPATCSVDSGQPLHPVDGHSSSVITVRKPTPQLIREIFSSNDLN